VTASRASTSAPRGRTAPRVAGLRSEVDDARAAHDSARIVRAQEELDFLTRELARCLGLGGRNRPAGSVAERARLNVTKAIRTALTRIAAQDPALGDHLARTIKTGMVCCYAVDPRLCAAWST